MGTYYLSKGNIQDKQFFFKVDGSYGEYATRVAFSDKAIDAHCNCPYPRNGCKHAVAAALKARDILIKKGGEEEITSQEEEAVPYLSGDDIRKLALGDRKNRAKSEPFTMIRRVRIPVFFETQISFIVYPFLIPLGKSSGKLSMNGTNSFLNFIGSSMTSIYFT